MTFSIDLCIDCGQACFPVRYCCPRCGGDKWRQAPAGVASVAQVTVVRMRIGIPAGENLHLASVQLLQGPVIIAQTSSGILPGEKVELFRDAEQRIIAIPCFSKS